LAAWMSISLAWGVVSIPATLSISNLVSACPANEFISRASTVNRRPKPRQMRRSETLLAIMSTQRLHKDEQDVTTVNDDDNELKRE
jgi:hypothetical protein